MHKNHTCSRKEMLFGLAAEGGKAKNHYFPEVVLFFVLGTPGLPKNTWPTNHVGIPLDQGFGADSGPDPVGNIFVFLWFGP